MTTSDCFEWFSNWEKLTPEKGAYVICIDLKTNAPAPPKFNADFRPGLYFYAGSANGPGGIQARCRRHLRQNKRPHWHIDWLTNKASDMHVLAFPNRRECNLMDTLISGPDAHIPFPGFGSSDCDYCAAHLVMCLTSHAKRPYISRYKRLFKAGFSE